MPSRNRAVPPTRRCRGRSRRSWRRVCCRCRRAPPPTNALMPGSEARIEIDLLVDEAVEHAADAGHAGAEHEGEDHHLVACRCPSAPPRRDPPTPPASPFPSSSSARRDTGTAWTTSAVPDDHRLDDRHVEAEDIDRHLSPFRIGIGADIGAEHAAERLLEDERHADGADQRRQRRDMAERPVGRSARRSARDRGAHVPSTAA